MIFSKTSIISVLLALLIIGISFWFYFASNQQKIYYTDEGCVKGEAKENYASYDKNSKILTIFITTNCCSINVSVERFERDYKIIERQFGELCKCVCSRKIKIFDVSEGSKVIFVRSDNESFILVPYVSENMFCGISTYGECNNDSDCITSGCSSQICQSKYEEPIFTTCEYRDCYDAKKYNLSCKCVNNKCQWVSNQV